jgi:type II secretory ATPase GspE/PulE/Tfp pilus assembly ATPase PilB-like protein
MSAKIPPLPTSVIDKVALDAINRIVYVEQRTFGRPIFQTWLDRAKHDGLDFKVQFAELDEIARYRRDDGMRVEQRSGELDLSTFQDALQLIATAARYGASDLHLMMKGDHTEIQVEVKGGLRVLKRATHDEGEALARSIYQGLATVSDASWEPDEFQHAQVAGEVLPPELGLQSLRIIRGPCAPTAQNGSFMTLRLQYIDSQAQRDTRKLPRLELPRVPDGKIPLGEQGLTPSQVEKLYVIMAMPYGLVFVTGPVGSGKTVTLYELLKELARLKPYKRQIAIEDPTEIPMPWALQLTVTGAHGDDENGAAYAECGRAALRMAPKTLFYGELRGPRVAETAVQAAITGHLTWTTLHCNDPFQVPERLEVMDPVTLNRHIFCDDKVVRALIATRLVPHLCPHCRISSKEPGAVSPRVLSALRTWGPTENVYARGPGCDACEGDGTTHRYLLAEIVITDEALMTDFVELSTGETRRRYRSRPDADPSILEAAIRDVLAGKLDPADVEDKVDRIMPNPDYLEDKVERIVPRPVGVQDKLERIVAPMPGKGGRHVV